MPLYERGEEDRDGVEWDGNPGLMESCGEDGAVGEGCCDGCCGEDGGGSCWLVEDEEDRKSDPWEEVGEGVGDGDEDEERV